MVPNVQSDNKIEIWLLEQEGFKSTPEYRQWRHRNDVTRHVPNVSKISQSAAELLMIENYFSPIFGVGDLYPV